MTVKELKEKLSLFSDNMIVMIPDDGWGYATPNCVVRGVNEADGCVFIDFHEEH